MQGALATLLWAVAQRPCDRADAIGTLCGEPAHGDGGHRPDALAQRASELRGLGKRNMFVTFSSIASNGSGALELALGLFEGRQFASCRFECEPGDLLLLLTDGLFEVFDRQGVELGLERVKRALAESADRPLSEISEALIRLARNQGAATDDQTLFLARSLTGTSLPQFGSGSH